jgi:hypothetical protein
LEEKVMRILALLFVALIAVSCDFELEKEYYKEVSPESNVFITVNLKDLPDTVLVLNEMEIKYDLDIEGAPFFAVYKLLDSTVEYLGYGVSGSFRVINNTQKDYSNLDVVVLSTTATGSLADKTFNELMLFGVRHVLRFVNTPTVPLNLSKVEIVNGAVSLSWPKYPYDNLVQLRLRRTLYKDNTSSALVMDEDLPVMSTQYVDRKFVGGRIAYELRTVNNRSQMEIGDTTMITARRPTIYTSTTGMKLTVSWGTPELYANPTGFQLNSFLIPPYFTVASLPAVATQTDISVPFGQLHTLTLTTHSIDPRYDLVVSSSVGLGEKVGYITSMLKDPARDRIFLVNPTMVLRKQGASMDTLRIQSSTSASALHLSSDGGTLYMAGADNGKISEIDANAWVVRATYTLNPVRTVYSMVAVGDYIYFLTNLFASSVRPAAFNKITGTTTLFGVPQTVWLSQIAVTPNQKYLLSTGDAQYAHEIKPDGSLFQVGAFEQPREASAKVISDTEYVLIYHNANSTQWLNRRFSLPSCTPLDAGTPIDKSPVVFDGVNGVLGCIQSGSANLEMFDYERNTKVSVIPLALVNSSDYPLLLSDNRVYANNYLLKF